MSKSTYISYILYPNEMEDTELNNEIEALTIPETYTGESRRLASMVYANGRLIIVIEYTHA